MLARLSLSTCASCRLAAGKLAVPVRRSFGWSLTPKNEATRPPAELDVSKEKATVDSIDNLLSVVSEYHSKLRRKTLH
jgi:hypothetical protein